MYGLDLFSGIGGISIALKQFVRTVAYCEQDRYAQAVLLSRMSEGKLDRAPIWDDVKTLRGELLPQVDIIFGGFPCQDISVAGHGEGLEGKRSGLFFEIIRLTQETGASFVFLENVPAIRTRGLREVVRAFTEIGYDCRWTCLSAASLGAPHKRERWFLLAHSDSAILWNEQGRGCWQERSRENESGNNGEKKSLADSEHKGLERHISETRQSKKSKSGISSWWKFESDVGRVVNGLPYRVDRIKCLGNSVVPQQVEAAFRCLIGMKEAS